MGAAIVLLRLNGLVFLFAGISWAATAPSFAANGKAISDWTEADLYEWVSTLKTLKPNTKKLLRKKAEQVVERSALRTPPLPPPAARCQISVL